MNSAIITLTTDFGLVDSYIAQMKGTILTINPLAQLVDITHQIPAQDIVRAAFVLNEIIDTFPKGTIHLIVVDPGVGSLRRLVAVEMASQKFVFPDNGLLGVVERRYIADRAVELTEQRFWQQPLQNPPPAHNQTKRSHTFHGRDIMAPVAAHWSLGHDLSRFGRPLEQKLQRIPIRQPHTTVTTVDGEVVWIDSYGNLITNIHESILPEAKLCELQVTIGQTHIAGIDQFYAQQQTGNSLALIGSSGQLEIAVNQGNAAQELGVSAGNPVQVTLTS